MAKNMEPATEVIYSFNEGKTWHTMDISDDPIDITNIIIEPQSISQQFVVYGTHFSADSGTKGVSITLDFKDLHEPQCQGIDRPGEADSDYELWSPNDGRHGDTQTKCYMGQ